MASDYQLRANRRNAQKSTGPRTAKGKGAAKMNAVTHGLSSVEVLIPDENSADFESFRHDAHRDLAPVGSVETELVERIVGCFWRLRRCSRIEAGLLGGGTHVMDKIESVDHKAFAEELEEEADIEDLSLREILYRAMRSRVAIHGRGGPVSELPFPGLSNEELIQAYKEECENEQQSNPLTYDVALGFSKNLSQPEALSKLARHESTLDRSLYRAMHELQRLQALRKGTSSGPPAAVDVSVSRK